MKARTSLIAALSLVLAASSIAESKNKKKPPQRGMLESMQAVPCGAKQRGVTGLGSVFASIGVEHVNSHEQLCPQYLFRTDDMEYHIRPLDLKHAVILPVGHEGEFKLKKDRLILKMPDGDKKAREYQVVAMQPANSESTTENSAYRPAEKPAESRPPVRDGSKVVGQTSSPPPPPQP
ncbi:MAG: hypothetical protein WCB94_13855 [Terriglobales bacterium]